MGLVDKLTTQGSSLTAFDGSTPSINPLATAQSKMHDSYSITGDNGEAVNVYYHQYLDGNVNLLPKPSKLDLGGIPPMVSPSGQVLPYVDNQPK